MQQAQAHRTYDAIVPIPAPALSIGAGVILAHDTVVELDFLWSDWRAKAPRSEFAERVIVALRDYFKRASTQFTLPLNLKGTPFQHKVWREMQRIPAGQTRSYGAIAKRLHSSPRAVGNACRSNPVPIIVPCHRIVAANGEIGGFAGQRDGPQLALKRWLLAHEANG